MARSKKFNPKACYISRRLRNLIDNSREYPVIFVSAPAGYGKTTLLNQIKDDEQTHRITVNDSSMDRFCSVFVECIRTEIPGLAGIIEKLTTTSQSEIMTELSVEISKISTSDRSVRIIIDDIHRLHSEELVLFLAKIAINSNRHISFIMTSRVSIWDDSENDVIKGNVCLIDAEALALNADGIWQYISMCGIKIKKHESESLYRQTDGWINVLFLMVLEYANSGKLVLTYDMLPFIEKQLGKILDEDELFAVRKMSLLYDFTEEQVSAYTGISDAGAFLNRLMKYNLYIRKDKVSGKYTFNCVFRSALEKSFRSEYPKEAEMLTGVIGRLYYEGGAFVRAAEYFYRAGMYEDMMKAIEKGTPVGRDEENIENYKRYYLDCPREIRSGYHLGMLYLAWRFFYFGELRLYQDASLEFLEDLYSDMKLSETERKSLLCDYSLFKAMTDYDDLDKMKQDYENAMAVFDGHSRNEHSVIPRTFGATSVLKLFNNGGHTDDVLVKINEISQLGSKLIGRDWRGISYAARAEAAYMAMDLENAEILVNCALRECSASNYGVRLCISFLSAKLALARGHYSLVGDELHEVFDYAEQEMSMPLRQTAEACRAWISAQLGMTGQIENWIRNGDFSEVKLLYPALPSVILIHVYVLIRMGKYTRALSFYEELTGNKKMTDNPIIQESAYTLFASACAQMGKTYNAREFLDKAMILAHNTGNYASIVVYGEELVSLLNDYSGEYGVLAERLVEEIRKYSENRKRIATRLEGSKFMGLTKREFQVAMYVKDGCINKEIAQKLGISENTVKSTLKRIFSKLDINSRRRLAELMKEYEIK